MVGPFCALHFHTHAPGPDPGGLGNYAVCLWMVEALSDRSLISPPQWPKMAGTSGTTGASLELPNFAMFC